VVSQADRRTQRRGLRKTIDEIFELDGGIRFVAVYQDQYLLAGGMRTGTPPYDPDDEAHEIDLQLGRIAEIAGSWQRWFGNLGALVLRYERLDLLFLPLSEGRFMVLSTEPGTNPLVIADRLRRHPDLVSLIQKIP
jgi:hypothetical protein